MKAESQVGSIEIVGDAIQLRRRQIWGYEAESRILKIAHITGIEFRKAGFLENGYIKIIHSGTTSSSSQFSLKAYDLDVVKFDITQQESFAQIRAKLMELITGSPFKDEEQQDEHSKLIATFILTLFGLFVIIITAAMIDASQSS